MSNTILLVDDEKNILRSLSRLLQQDNYQILTADSGREGLRLLSEHEVQVVVSDYDMPGMAGVEFVSRVKELYPSTVRLLMGEEAELKSIGEDHYPGAVYKFLAKPWEDKLLRKQIRDAFTFQHLVQKNRQFSSAFENISEGIMITDAGGTIQSVNPAFSQITGLAQQEVIGTKVQDISPAGQGMQEIYADLWDSLRDFGQWHGKIWQTAHRGEKIPQWTSVQAIKDLDNKISQLVFSFFDSGYEAHRGEERLENIAYHDRVTGLPNRLLLLDRLEMALEQAKRNENLVGLIFLDLDRFKIINDTLGFELGDELLQKVGARLQHHTRKEDTVARLSGDEFTILVPRLAQIEDALTVTRKIQTIFKAPFRVRDHEVLITPSLGISLYPYNGTRAETLMKNADTAMDWAKEQGGNCYCFYTPTMHAAAFRRLTLVSSLHQALEKNQFVLHFQPQLDLATRRITGAEALVRWQDPEFGLISPNQFIPIAEESELIIPIGAWTLHRACQQGRIWYEKGFRNLRVAVNLSAKLFSEQDLLGMVQEALEESGLPAPCLELEITEGVLMQNAATAVAILDKLKSMGIQISMDDFGTGYSSLSYLKRFPIDTLKIDKSFVRDVTTNPDDAAIVTAIIAMAHSLNMKALAEGVESVDQAAYLRELGCERIQGFLISPAVPALEFEEMITAERHKGQLTMNGYREQTRRSSL